MTRNGLGAQRAVGAGGAAGAHGAEGAAARVARLAQDFYCPYFGLYALGRTSAVGKGALALGKGRSLLRGLDSLGREGGTSCPMTWRSYSTLMYLGR